jgi:PAS domain S-box-containing protein
MTTPTTLPEALTEIEELRGQVRELLSLLGQEAPQEPGAAGRTTHHPISQKQMTDTLLREIVEGTASATGNAFFKSLVQQLAKALNVRYAFVGEWRENQPDKIRMLAVWSGTAFVEPLEYDLMGTPCTNVVSGEFCFYANAVQQLFPKDRLLEEMSVESYCGMPFFGKSANPLGILVVMDNRPMTNSMIAKDLLSIFASRAAAEMERARTEVLPASSEQRLQDILDSMFGFVALYTMDGRIVEINQAPLDIGRVPKEDVLDQYFWETPWWSDLPEMRSRLQDWIGRAAQGEQVRGELEFRLPSGEMASADATFGPLRDASGTIANVIGFGVDITERKRAESALQQSEAHFRALIENSSDIITVLDLDGTIRFESPSFERLLGYTQHEIDGRIAFDFIHPDDLPTVLKKFQLIVQRPGETHTAEFRFRHQDGSWREFEGVGRTARDSHDRPCVIVNSRDITERKQAERSLLQTRDLLTCFVENVPAAVAMLDRELRYVAVSRRWQTDYRLGDEPLVGRRHYDVFPEIQDMKEWQEIHQRCLSGSVERREEDRFVRADGSEDWLRWEVRPWRDVTGKIGGIIMFTEVITERKQAEEALRASEERFAVAVEGSTDVLWDAHRIPGAPWHEPNTPIWWSPRVRQLLCLEDREPFDTLGQWVARLHPDDMNHVLGRLAAHIEQRVPYDVEYRMRTNRGEYRWLRGRGQATWDEQGEPRRMSGSCQDISDRKQTEQALKTSDEQLRQALLASNTGLWDWNTETGEVSFSKEWKSQLGFSETELPDRFETWETRLHPDDRPRAIAYVQNYLAHPEGEYRLEFRLRHKDETYRWIEARASLIGEPDGRRVRLLGSHTDITARKQMEAELAEREERLRLFIEHSPVALAMLDREMRYVAVSRRWLTDYRLGEQDLIGRHHYDVFPEILAMPEWQEVHQRCLLGAVERREEDHFVRVDGTEEWTRWEIRPWHDVIGEIGGIIMFTEVITERKRADDTLRKSEQRFHFAVEATSDGIWDWDIRTGVVYFSPQWMRLLGYVSDEIVRSTEFFFSLVHPDDRARTAQVLQEHLDGRIPVKQLEIRLRRKSGDYRWYLDRGKVVARDQDGRPLRMVGTITDITERKQVEEDLKASEERYACATAVGRVGVWELDALQGLFNADENLKALLGYTKEELSTDPLIWLDLVHPDDRATALEAWNQVLQGLVDSYSYEVRMTRKDGSIIWTHVRGHANRNKTGNVVQLIGATVDVTDRKRAEAALRESEERYRTLVDLSPNGVFVYSNQKKVYVNQAACMILGVVSPEQLIEDSAVHFSHPDSDKAIHASLAEILGTGVPVRRVERTYQKLDGTQIIVEVDAGRITWNGEPAIQVIFADITERKKREEELRLSKFLIDRNADAVYWIDPDARILDVNEAASLMLGYTMDELCAMTVHDLNPDFTAAIWPGFWAETRQVGSMLLETAHRTKDGRLIPIEVRVNFLAYEGKEYHCAFVRDITERKRSELALKQAQDTLRQTQFSVDHASDGFFWIGPDARILDVNEAACRLLEYTHDELTAMTVYDIDPSFSLEGWPDRWEAFKEKGSMTFESKHWSKTGRVVDAEVTVNYLRYDGKEFNCAIMRDIGERKRAEAELRQSHAFIRQVIDTDPNFIFAKDREGRFTLANLALAEAYGTTVENLIGKTDSDFNHNLKEVAFFRRKDIEAMDSLLERFIAQETITDATGQVRWLQTVKRPLVDAQGRATMVLGASTDITARKHVEMTLRQRERDLRAAVAERERISEDLHDGILQSIFAVGLGLESCRTLVSQLPLPRRRRPRRSWRH